METTENKLLEIIKKVVPNYDPSESLKTQISSLELFSLIPKIEKTFQIEIFSIEIGDAHFESVPALTHFINSKISGSGNSR
jgi:acyl carrier protein